MTIAPDLLPFVERQRAAWPVPGHRLPVAEWRDTYESMVASARPPRPAGLRVTDAVVGEPATRVRVYVPEATPRGAIVYFHGGGWVIGSIGSHDDITADLAHETHCAVVSVDYSRAPEHAFPTAYGEASGVVRWVLADGLREHGVSAVPVLVAGDSAGGNLAAATALTAALEGKTLAGQVLLYPCVDTDFGRPSYVEGRDAPFLDAEQMTWFWQQYATTPAARQDWRAVPMRATDDQLRHVAPAFVTAAEHDPLRDEGIAYAQRLRDAGCAVHLEPGDGLVHGYARLRGAAREPARIWRAMVDWAIARTGGTGR